MEIYCVDCEKEVTARLINGEEAYPHRENLYKLPFWICDTCKNFVGCHHKTSKPTRPLGVIPNKELKKYRLQIHAILDPMWRSGLTSRKKIYKHLNKMLGKQYHTADIRTIEEAQNVQKILLSLRDELNKYKK